MHAYYLILSSNKHAYRLTEIDAIIMQRQVDSFQKMSSNLTIHQPVWWQCYTKSNGCDNVIAFWRRLIK